MVIGNRPDVAALHRAYEQAAPDTTDDRLIGAILLHAIDAHGNAGRPLECRTVDLAAGEPLIRQGTRVGEMYVVLSSTAPPVVLHRTDATPEPRQVATITRPTVLGEIGMWRGQPAVATVLSPEPKWLELLVIDAEWFESLEQEPGFRAATAAGGLAADLAADTAIRLHACRIGNIERSETAVLEPRQDHGGRRRGRPRRRAHRPARAVEVQMVLSEPGAKTAAGMPYSFGTTLADIVTEMRRVIGDRPLKGRMRLTPLRFSSLAAIDIDRDAR